ncbi:helix-turn-helix domain-containing protein [Alkalicoccus halolimnae]|uniref:Helix-turn-helix domain-containing protein n=1 Tax=Alkalicoccus halolimnae TaxID=1667239 RepID=A0A5C7F375_9BACI|nr:helix-turn-helix domain-containing protein [Alkalicoccus halolimnae]TXF85062.1 helix-turn-helix transcriptional regulator [Alkalicoccus halolimnae]
MEIDLGRKVRDLRKFYGISQKEVCENICNQSYISKLEKGLVHPSANMLSMLADRLGVSTQYFFDYFVDVTQVNYVYQVIDFISKNLDRAKYEDVLAMVEAEEKNPLFRGHQLQQFLLWRKGICIFHIDENKFKAISFLDKAIEQSETTNKNKSEIELDILLSKANIYSMVDEHNHAAALYEELLSASRKHPYLQNDKLVLRIYYNYSKNQFDQNQFKKSVGLAKSGIKQCLNTDSLYMLADLYFQCGQSLWHSNKKQIEEPLLYLEKSRNVFMLRENEEFAGFVEEEIEDIKNYVKHTDL